MRRSRYYQKGYVYKKGRTWHVRYRDYTTNPPCQQSHKLCNATGQYKTKSAAQSLAEEFLKPYNDGTYLPENTVSLSGYIEDVYLPDARKRKAPSTSHGYAKLYQTYLAGRTDLALRDVRPVDCQVILDKAQREQNLSKNSLAHLKSLLSAVFRYAIRTGVLSGPNPVRETILPTAKQNNPTHAYTLNEVTNMLAVLPDPAKVIVAVAAFTGLRRGEIRALKPEDYDGKTLRVERSAWKEHIGPPKGRRGKGSVLVIKPLADLLDEYLTSWDSGEYLFPNVHGGPASLDYLSCHIIKPVLQENGLQWHGWHAFRRGLATNLHELGVPDIVIQAILRHSSVTVTRESYIKRDGVDAPSIAAMKALENAWCAPTVQPEA